MKGDLAKNAEPLLSFYPPNPIGPTSTSFKFVPVGDSEVERRRVIVEITEKASSDGWLFGCSSSPQVMVHLIDNVV